MFGDSLGPELATTRDTEAVTATDPAIDPANDPVIAEESAHESADESADGSVVAPVRRVWADEARPPTALTWLAADSVLAEPGEAPATADLFAGAALTPEWRRPRILVPVGIVAALCAGYVSTTLLWSLDEIAPTVQASSVQIAPAPPASVAWPATGSAAVGIPGIPTVASTSTPSEIASITKVVSVLMVLDELPMKVGEQGPSFSFTYADTLDYWRYRSSDQSSLDVPVGGSLTEYQMLQGILLGSANNYIDRLAEELWGSPRGFAEAAERWLNDRGITDVTLKSPSGFSEQNVASPASLIRIGELAMANPVFAEIVATRTAEIPGVGVVTNTNEMLEDPGVVGVKTGTLEHWNLLTAKDVRVGDTTVRVYTSVLGQDSNDDRIAATRALLAGVEADLVAQEPAVPAGTVVGQVRTEWGERVDVVTDADVPLVLWNGAPGSASTEFSLGERAAAGSTVGTLTAEGPLNTAQSSVSLADDVPAPSAWWRLTHPLELFGLDKD